MAGNLQQRLESIKAKADIITTRYRNEVEKNRAAEAEIDSLRRSVRRLQQELAEARLKIEHLTVVTTLTPKRAEIEQTRVILSELVREIDNCINELNQ